MKRSSQPSTSRNASTLCKQKAGILVLPLPLNFWNCPPPEPIGVESAPSTHCEIVSAESPDSVLQPKAPIFTPVSNSITFNSFTSFSTWSESIQEWPMISKQCVISELRFSSARFRA